MALTDIKVRKATARDKAYKMSDGGGLFLWVTPSGGKLWRWAYRFEGKQKLMAFGNYPDVSLAMARERHAAERAVLASVLTLWRNGRRRRSRYAKPARTPSRV